MVVHDLLPPTRVYKMPPGRGGGPPGGGGGSWHGEEATLELEIKWDETPRATDIALLFANLQAIADMASRMAGEELEPLQIELIHHPNMAVKARGSKKAIAGITKVAGMLGGLLFLGQMFSSFAIQAEHELARTVIVVTADGKEGYDMIREVLDPANSEKYDRDIGQAEAMKERAEKLFAAPAGVKVKGTTGL